MNSVLHLWYSFTSGLVLYEEFGWFAKCQLTSTLFYHHVLCPVQNPAVIILQARGWESYFQLKSCIPSWATSQRPHVNDGLGKRKQSVEGKRPHKSMSSVHASSPVWCSVLHLFLFREPAFTWISPSDNFKNYHITGWKTMVRMWNLVILNWFLFLLFMPLWYDLIFYLN